MKRIAQTVATFMAGLFAGSMFLIVGGLIPYWKSVSPEMYRLNFQLIGPYLGAVMVPLMVLSILLTAVAAYLSKENRKPWLVAFVLLVLIVPLYALVHGPVNAQLLSEGDLSTEVITQLRSQWLCWHWVRTIAGAVAFASCIVGSRFKVS